MSPTNPDHRAHQAPHGHGAHPGLHNEEVAHEHSDVNVRALLMFCAGLVIVAVVVHVAMWGLFEVFESQAAQNDPIVTPLARPAGQLPPEPRLLENEPRNLEEITTREAQMLHQYGWVDQNAGTARIPIDEAKKKLLEAGLPVRPEGPVDDRLGTNLPARGEASSGRIITVRPEQSVAPAPAQGTTPTSEDKPAPPQKSGGH